ncbi:hypothetical protein BDR03DRAFT_1010000 [Suillus americanus]|nr:hypothetical protein BDR03DRAFT_1010000 [Suillus americanus]
MAPEATEPKPRPRLVPKKSRTPMGLKLQGSKNQVLMSEHLQESLSSPEEDIFRSQLCGPDSWFSFVPPNVFTEADNMEDKDSSEDSEKDKDALDDDNDDLDNGKDDLDDNKHGTDANDSNEAYNDHDDDIPSPPQSTNNSCMKTKKHTSPTSSSQSTDNDATLPPPHMKKQDRAIMPPPCHRQATNNPGRGNHHTGSPNNAGSIHDVLEDHHRKNHRPCAPDSDRLKNLHQQAAGESSADEEDKVVDPPKRSHSANKAASQTIGFYPHSWKDDLEALKKKSQLGLVMDGTTSSHNTFIEKTGIEYLMETLNDFAADDIGIDDGYWDIYKCDMAIIVHRQIQDEQAAWPIAASKFGILPSDIDDDKEFEDYVSQRVTELLNGGYFLQNGVDEQRRTNNLTDDALGELCSTIFYKGNNALAKAFPNVFAEAIPKGAVALAATALAAAIDEYKTGVYQPTKFAADLYQPIYENVIELYTSFARSGPTVETIFTVAWDGQNFLSVIFYDDFLPSLSSESSPETL